jgi:hypothetical protein
MSLPQPLGPATASVALAGGTGSATANIGPVRVRENWQLTACGVKATFPGNQTSPTNDTECFLYAGSSAGPTTFVGKSVTGSSGDTCGLTGVTLQPGQQIWCVWVGGDAGQIATMTVYGTYTIGR